MAQQEQLHEEAMMAPTNSSNATVFSKLEQSGVVARGGDQSGSSFRARDGRTARASVDIAKLLAELLPENEEVELVNESS